MNDETTTHIFAVRTSKAGWEAGAPAVAQVSNLLYRRLPVGKALKLPARPRISRLAGWKPAIQQTGSLRYRKLMLPENSLPPEDVAIRLSSVRNASVLNCTVRDLF